MRVGDAIGEPELAAEQAKFEFQPFLEWNTLLQK
jgi:hypothetical protein